MGKDCKPSRKRYQQELLTTRMINIKKKLYRFRSNNL